MFDYPAPRYPKLKKPKSLDELMPNARALVGQSPGSWPTSLKPSYGIKTGDKILFVVLSEYDSMVINAMCMAMKEKGALVDLLTLDSTPIAPPEEVGAHEAIALDKDEGDYNYYYSVITNLIRTSTVKAMVESEKYNMVIGGLAGPIASLRVPWYRFHFISLEDFFDPSINSTINFPVDLQRLIDEKVFAQIASCTVLRLTDPEGTDIKWTNYDDKRRFSPGHLFARPFNIGYGFGGRDVGGKDDCTGIVAGTLNHMGAFPHCKAYIEGGLVVKVEGGGKYGEVWREKIEKYKNTKLPPCPIVPVREHAKYVGESSRLPLNHIGDPGIFWYHEAAIGTTPGIFRLPGEGLFKYYANFLHERKRSGYIHNGFGPNAVGMEGLIKTGLPWTHLHIHTIFNTLEGKSDKGETITIIKKGHLAALDDPEVRLLASQYGDPKEMLREAWVPAVPGINVPGDYMKDYGSDPVSWIKKETMEHPVWIE